ncbi:hypothetical protein JYG54_23955, partial [Escherichia fergusonii]|nr:hypothetical protein [Escherichia fergusonii]
LFAQLAEVCPPQTLLTTNTSSISITAIAAEVKNPQSRNTFKIVSGRLEEAIYR